VPKLIQALGFCPIRDIFLIDHKSIKNWRNLKKTFTRGAGQQEYNKKVWLDQNCECQIFYQNWCPTGQVSSMVEWTWRFGPEPLVKNLTPQFLIHVPFLLHSWIDLAVLLLLVNFFFDFPNFWLTYRHFKKDPKNGFQINPWIDLGLASPNKNSKLIF